MKKLADIKRRDNIKSEYCKKNNIYHKNHILSLQHEILEKVANVIKKAFTTY